MTDRLAVAVTATLAALGLFFSTATPASAVSGPLPGPVAAWSTSDGTDGRVYIADEQGRARQLRGGNHKTDDPDTLTNALLAAAAERGLDHIRLAIYWQFLEPTQDTFNAAYLAKIEAALDRAQAHGILVILDMHQDVFGEAFGSTGVPTWATRTDGVPYEQQSVWLLNYLQPAVQNAFDHLYEDADLRQHQIDAWMYVVNAVKDHPAVLGYDLMNEPFGKFRAGEDFPTAAARVESQQLTPMYQRLTDAIAVVDDDHWVFIEPPNLASIGITTSLGNVIGPKVAIYPHMYDASIESATYSPGGVVQYDATFFAKWSSAISPYVATNPMPLLVGEWGVANPEAGGMGQFVRDSLSTLDDVGSGWSVFNWCFGGGYCPLDADGNDRPGIEQIFHPYARAVAGAPTHSTWDPDSRTLHVQFAHNAATGATEIFLPVSRRYADGWKVATTDGENEWSYTFNETTGVLSVTSSAAVGNHAICVTPANDTSPCAVTAAESPTPTTAAPPTALPTVTPTFTG